ncbi:hypothetical protein N9X24_03265 [Rickettsiales bacterium]|nr:hypothetical protein [Rickettsiales bacterium]
MFERNSLTTRIAIGKLTGFLIAFFGILIFNFITEYQLPTMFAFGIVLWYITIGAIIGIFGVYREHPILKFPMRWWLRSSIIGGWMNFILVLLSYEQLEEIIIVALGFDTFFRSPFWFTLEGIFAGLIIGYFSTKFGGEGQKIVGK